MLSVQSSEPESVSPTQPPSRIYGNLQKYGKFDVKILKKTQLSHDVYKYICELPDPALPLGIYPADHFNIHAIVPPKNKSIKRIYTPTSPSDQLGTFDLVFKVYRKDVHPKYKNGGLMTQYLESLGVGDSIQISKLPAVFFYGEPGILQSFNLAYIPVKKLGLIGGGTGICVFYPIIIAILNNPHDKTQVTLLMANNAEEDIIFKAELEEAAKDPRIKVHYTLAKPPINWKGYEGFVDRKMIQETMPEPGNDSFIWVCGPPEMDNALAGELEELKYPKLRTVIGSWYRSYLRIGFMSLFCRTYRKKN